MVFNTGSIQRKLIAIVEDFKRVRETWGEINTHAYTTANTLCNSVIQSRYVDEPQYWHPLLRVNHPNLAQKFDAKIQRIVENQNLRLVDLVEKLAKQYHKMVGFYKELYILYEDLKCKYGVENVDGRPVFLTCPLKTYLTRMKPIIQMYKRELNTKRSCTSLKGYLNVATREEGITLLSVWINQPGIVKSIVKEWEDLIQTEMKLLSDRQ